MTTFLLLFDLSPAWLPSRVSARLASVKLWNTLFCYCWAVSDMNVECKISSSQYRSSSTRVLAPLTHYPANNTCC